MPAPSPTIVRSLGLPPRLAPYTDRILAHVDSLGGYTPLVMSLAKAIRPVPRTIIDLACGKGHLSVRLAAIGTVLAVDAHRPFVVAARNLASSRGVSRTCRFRVDLIRSFCPPLPVDLACMIGLLPAAAGAKVLRRLVHPGGHYIIDDCIRVSTSRRFRHVPTLVKVRKALSDLGDTLVQEVVVPEQTVFGQSRRIRAAVARAVRELVKTHPECEHDAAEFLAALEESSRLLSGPLRPTIWLVRRGD
ncbi:MAG: methyltransferase domain-containing protein [Planctomycetota bacterium]|nr:methyltransferase domain-containing protein [Planctomycetota bacterium]